MFCGAGISANSGMPTARELIDRLADALPCEAQDRAALGIDTLPFEAFLQILSEGAPLEPMIGLYKASRPTAAHRLVARLVRQGYLRSVFTTNFDLLLERAFAAEGLRRGADYKRLVRVSEFEAYPDRTGCPQLIKVHGSADYPDSVAATIRAVASRQSSVKQARLLRALFAGDKRRTLLVIGYSGSDKFDIMPQLAAVPEPRASILVVTHLPGASIANAIVRTNATLPEGNNWKSAGPVTEIQIDTDLLLAQLSQTLFLPKALSDRVGRIAEGTGRARSEILVEALEAFLSRRNPAANEDAFAARLARFERHVEAIRRHQGLQWEVLARNMRHQMLTAAALPRADAATEAAAARAFEAVIDEIADRLAGKEAPPAADAGIAKVRRFH